MPLIIIYCAISQEFQGQLFNSTCLSLFFALFSLSLFYFAYFCLHWVFVVACGLSLVAAVAGLLCCGVQASLAVLLVAEHRPRACGFSECSTGSVVAVWRPLEHKLSIYAWVQLPSGLWSLPGPHVPCIGRRMLIHCATREVEPLIITIQERGNECEGPMLLLAFMSATDSPIRHTWGACERQPWQY